MPENEDDLYRLLIELYKTAKPFNMTVWKTIKKMLDNQKYQLKDYSTGN